MLVRPASNVGAVVRPGTDHDPLDITSLLQENTRLRSEVDRLRRQAEELRVFEALACQDPLTGLANRRMLDRRLGEELARYRRTRTPVSVMVIDVDGFKRVNDVFGHPAGDRILTWVALLLQGLVRGYDVCARWGGDEFVVLLPDTDAEGCMRFAERLRRALAAANARAELPISLSIGMASARQDNAAPEALFQEADADLYRRRREYRAAARAPGDPIPLEDVRAPADMLDDLLARIDAWSP